MLKLQSELVDTCQNCFFPSAFVRIAWCSGMVWKKYLVVKEKLNYCTAVCRCWSVPANSINVKTCFLIYTLHKFHIIVPRKTRLHKRNYWQRYEEHYPPDHLLCQEFKARQESRSVQNRWDYLRGNESSIRTNSFLMILSIIVIYSFEFFTIRIAFTF